MSDNDTRSQSKLHEMVVRGSDYKEDYELELFGEEITLIIQTLVDDEFLPIAAVLSQHLDVDDSDEAVSEAIDEADEDHVDVSQMDEEFVKVMQRAAKWGLYGEYDDEGEVVKYSDEEAEEIVEHMVGGTSVEIGARVLEVSGDVRDAEKFRGGRGRVASSRDS